MQLKCNQLDSKLLEVMLDLSLTVVDQETGQPSQSSASHSYGNNNPDYYTPTITNHPQRDLPEFNDTIPSSVATNQASVTPISNGDSNLSSNSFTSIVYDADDEDHDEVYLFPCHITFDDCHPELLADYHRDHLKSSRTSVQLVKHPRLCEYVVGHMFKILRHYLSCEANQNEVDLTATGDLDLTRDIPSPFSTKLGELIYNDPKLRHQFRKQEQRKEYENFNEKQHEDQEEEDEDEEEEEDTSDSNTVTKYLDTIINMIRKLNKVCVNEKKNCRIIGGKTEILNILLDNILHLLNVAPERQHIYLEPLLKFILTLADYKISGAQLRQIFEIIKNENTDLRVSLKSLDRLLSHHYRILRNIQPLRSINFPTASRTAEEIEYDSYISNSWHWRLRSKVIEYKRKRSRSSISETGNNSKQANSATSTGNTAVKPEDLKHQASGEPTTSGESAKTNTKDTSESIKRISPSWLECSLITPLSNISPLIHNGEIRFCCSMWVSVCGDLLVTDGGGSKHNNSGIGSRSAAGIKGDNDDGFKVNWQTSEGHWLRLTSRKRLARRYKEAGRKLSSVATHRRNRRLSVKIRRRQAHDKEDEEREEINERMRKSEPELNNKTFGGLNRLKLRFMHSSSSQLRIDRSHLPRKNLMTETTSSLMMKKNKLSSSRPPKEFLGRRARDNSQELLLHLVSFAIDGLTIEIWLNVKSMTFCARACRIVREGQTNLLDQVTFPSHLKADGSWSHLMFCLSESSSKSSGEKVMNLKVIVNGVNKEKEKLVYGAHKSPLTNFACLLGCERSTFGYVWKLSQIHLYKSMPDKNLPIFLLGKGPDLSTFTNFHRNQQQSTLPLADICQRSPRLLMNPKILNRYGTIDEELCLNWLTQNVVIAYVAHQPDYFLDYSPSMSSGSITNSQPIEHQFCNSAERFIQAKTLDFSRGLKFSHNNEFGSALVESGGIESVLIAFADVIRRSGSQTPITHSLAFSILLKMSQTNQYHLNKFLDELNGLKLTEFILTHPGCIVSRSMLECYLDFCLMKPRAGDTMTTTIESGTTQCCLIKSHKLIYHLMSSWRAWHKDLKVAKLLYRRLIRLLQPTDASTERRRSGSRVIRQRLHQPEERRLESIYIDYNFRMMTNAGGIDILMSILRECLVPLDENVPMINHELVEMIVNLISLLIKHPPGLDVMLDIMEFLLFLHPDPKAYVETTTSRTSFLRPLKGYNDNEEEEDDNEIFDDNSRPRTPESETGDSRQSDLKTKRKSTVKGATSPFSGESNFDESQTHSRQTLDSSSNEDVYRGLRGRISEDCLENFVDFNRDTHLAEGFNLSASVKGAYFPFVNMDPQQQQQEMNDNYQDNLNDYNKAKGDLKTETSDKSSNRNYAIANIADMLASIVKLTSTDPMNILSEALQKPIIDARKLIILANNNSPLVREKVLRLFLYCIRACYSLNLKTILAKYEQDSRVPTFKTCIPIQLMARQLLKYPTTMKMIQLCYGIIVGIDDFEAVDTVCLTFDIETINNNLQLNTLMLLIQLIPQLQDAKDIESALRFVHAYIKQLIKLGESETANILIKNNLVDTLMRVYFICVENELSKSSSSKLEDEKEGMRKSAQKDFNLVKQELDRILIFIVRFYIQNLPTSDVLKSIEDLLLYCDLMNTCVSPRCHHILRDRKVKILLVALRYCKLYEKCARRKPCGPIEYILRSFFKDNQLNTFENILPEHKLDIQSDGSLPSDEVSQVNSSSSSSRRSLHAHSSNDDFTTTTTHGTSQRNVGHKNGFLRRGTNGSDGQDVDFGDDDDQDQDSDESDNEKLKEFAASNVENIKDIDGKDIKELDVLDRFKTIFELILQFVTTRESGAIPSPLERRFVLRCVKILSGYLTEHNSIKGTKQRKLASMNGNRKLAPVEKSQWTLMLPKMERLLRSIFSRLVLFLLSPCDSMNLDERKYYAFTLLDMFSVEHLISLLETDTDKSTYKILLVFIKDLIEFNKLSFMFDDSSSDQEDDMMADDTEAKLRSLARSLEFELGLCDSPKSNGFSRRDQQLSDISKLDTKFKDVWLADLSQIRDDAREKLELIKNFNNSIGNKSTVQFTSISNGVGGVTSDDALSDRSLDEAVNITKDVVNDKHEQRKVYLEDLKQTKVYNYHIRQQWLSLIIGHTHERAIWYIESHYPKSWELNPVEGPSRIRRRLRPCKLALDSKFLRANSTSRELINRSTQSMGNCSRLARSSRQNANNEGEGEDEDMLLDGDWYNQYSPHPLCSMVINQEQSIDSNELRIRMFTTDKIHFNCDCSIIRPNEVCDGEVSIASWCIHFIGERSDSYQQHLNNNALVLDRFAHERDSMGSNYYMRQASKTTIRSSAVSQPRRRTAPFTSTVVEDLWFDEIVEIWDRRYQLQDVGLEIFLTNNMTYLISFRSVRDREDFKHNLMREQHKMINLQRFNLNTSLNRLTHLWRDGRLTNFDYLTCLNKLAGRSFNDLMQYPVFPFVLSNYTSDLLDLTKESEFRKLKKPMAIQSSDKETNFINNYQISQTTNLSVGPCGMNKPYHYSNHYSNSATVLHFLVRLPPFTQMLIQYQDNNFDQPDRTFHSIASTWQLITHDSNTDFKELIPEFFFLPEMFMNLERFELGRKQNNELVDDVRLPPWCPNSDARMFTLIHRQALESAYVSENLHHWIDLIFGYKQTGKAAVDAINVFHPATYYGEFDLNRLQSQLTASPQSSASIAPSINRLNENTTLTATNSTARSSNNSSDYITPTTIDLDSQAQQQQQAKQFGGAGSESTTGSPLRSKGSIKIMTQQQFKRQQADIERSALETMIKTYGQMPRQLFIQPVKQRSMSTFVQQQLNQAYMQQQISEEQQIAYKRLEPLRQVRGLRWGSFVGSPDEPDIVAVKHKRIVDPVAQNQQHEDGNLISSNPSGQGNLLRPFVGSAAQRRGGTYYRDHYYKRPVDKFVLHLLPNGEVAIMRSNTSLMLDYRADRKPSGSYQLSLPSTRYSRRAGLSSVARMNLFSNMIISRQQFSFIEPNHYGSPNTTSASITDTFNSTSSSLVSITTPRVKFSLDSLSLVSWMYLDGTIRIRHPAMSSQKPSLPLVQANTIVDTMTTCSSVPELNLLLVGYRSGSICAHIVSTFYETAPINVQNYSSDAGSSSASAAALLSSSAAPSAVHFLHTTSSGSSTSVAANASLGPGKVTEKSITGEPYTAVSLAGKTLHSVRSINKTTRWLYCHNKRVNCIKINVSFGIVVTGSDDGTSVIWDLNSLTYVRTIDYKLSTKTLNRKLSTSQDNSLGKQAGSNQWANDSYYSSRQSPVSNQRLLDYLCNCDRRRVPSARFRSESPDVGGVADIADSFKSAKKCSICSSGINAIAISDTLGDIVTVKDINNRLALATDFDESEDDNEDLAEPTSGRESPSSSSCCMSSSGAAAAAAESIESEDSLSSVVYVHTINGSLVGFVNCHTRVTAVCYSHAPEGISVNVIVIGLADGSVRLYSSWDLSRVKEFRLSGLGSPISSLMYSRDNQLLYVAYGDGQLVVLRNKKKGSIALPKEWFL